MQQQMIIDLNSHVYINPLPVYSVVYCHHFNDKMAEPIYCDNKCKQAATEYCRQCHKFLCENCLQLHKNWDDFSGHEILATRDMTNSVLESMKNDLQPNCHLHEIPLGHYCDDCKLVLCLHCFMDYHRDHSAFSIVTSFPRHKEVIERALVQVRGKSEAVQKARTILIDRVDAVTENKNIVCKNISRHAQEVIDSVVEAKDWIVAQVNTSTDHKVHTIGQIQDKADRDYVMLKSCEEHIQNRLKGSKVSVLLDKVEMMQKMTDVSILTCYNQQRKQICPLLKTEKSSKGVEVLVK